VIENEVRKALLRHTRIAALIMESQNLELDPIDAGETIIAALAGEQEAVDLVRWAIKYRSSVFHAYCPPPTGSAQRQILQALRGRFLRHTGLTQELCRMTATEDLRLNREAVKV